MYKMASEGAYYFLSRPRRFGKSLLLSTLEAYFEGRKELFQGLAVEQLEQEWRRHPILHLDLNSREYKDEASLEAELNRHLEGWERLYGSEYGERAVEERFIHVITKAFEQEGERVVILVDEYDKPLLQVIGNDPLQAAYRSKLKAFYSVLKSCDRYIRFALLTGVTKFGKVSVFSDLNNLKDVSMLPAYSNICGITETELHTCFDSTVKELAEYNSMTIEDCYARLRRDFDGYHFNEYAKEGVYNPFSVLNTLDSKVLRDYWFETGTPSFLVYQLKKTGYPLEAMTQEELTADTLNSIDIMDENPLPLLYQSGYLTLKGFDHRFDAYVLGFPNREVEEGFIKYLLPFYTPKVQDKSSFSIARFVKDVERGDADGFMRRLEAFFANGDYQVMGNLEVYFQNTLYVFFRLMGFYVEVERHTTDGRMDMVVKTKDNIYIIEFKLNQSAAVALQQIEEKGYAKPFATDPRRLFKIGVNFNTAAGRLTATVAAGETTLADATVAWSSSNEAVATIDAQGNVTLVAAGNATLKAEYAGDDNYKASQDTYELTVENSAYQPVGQGTLENPFTATDAIWMANNGEYIDEECYIKGIVFRVATTDANITNYGNIVYYISEDGEAKTPSFEVYRGKYFDGERFTVDNKVLVGDEVVVKGKLAMYNTQAETAQGAVLVKLVRDGQEIKPGDVVNTPVISGEDSFDEQTTVTITADEGCTIHYTLDGTDPTTASTVYTEPLTLTETTTVKAIAAKGETVSGVATATFTKNEVLEGGIVFNFNDDYTTLFSIDEVTDEAYNFEQETNSATLNGVYVTVSPAEEGVTNANHIWKTAPRLRLYSGFIKFTSTTYKIERIVLTRTTNGSLVANQNTADSGVLTTSEQQNNAEVTWTGKADAVTITIAGNTQFSRAVVFLSDETSPVDAVTAFSAANASNVLHNLAGQCVGKGYKGLVVIGGKKMMVK